MQSQIVIIWVPLSDDYSPYLDLYLLEGGLFLYTLWSKTIHGFLSPPVNIWSGSNLICSVSIGHILFCTLIFSVSIGYILFCTLTCSVSIGQILFVLCPIVHVRLYAELLCFLSCRQSVHDHHAAWLVGPISSHIEKVMQSPPPCNFSPGGFLPCPVYVAQAVKCNVHSLRPES